MVRYATKFGVEKPYLIPNPGPTPKIDIEEGLPPGGLDIAWVEHSRKFTYHWQQGLKWYDRLHAHATLSSARKNHKCKRPFEPADELDFVLDSVYDPLKDPFSEKQDVYLQWETARVDDEHVKAKKRHRRREGAILPSVSRPSPQKESWRILRNTIIIYPDQSLPREHPIRHADLCGQRRENIYNVKLGIAADHSPQTNPGYSRTPSGAFFAI